MSKIRNPPIYLSNPFQYFKCQSKLGFERFDGKYNYEQVTFTVMEKSVKFFTKSTENNLYFTFVYNKFLHFDKSWYLIINCFTIHTKVYV